MQLRPYNCYLVYGNFLDTVTLSIL